MSNIEGERRVDRRLEKEGVDRRLEKVPIQLESFYVCLKMYHNIVYESIFIDVQMKV